MAQEQQTDQDISDLENRLERLRILYEQYFMGIEKREPGVQRKDVERRIQQLRKIRFQSTASRFKFQTMVQRFNTLQQYWNRTCREIENGTYRRHLQRAARRLATNPPAGPGTNEELGSSTDRAQVREAASKDLTAMLDEDVDLEAEMAGALAALEKSPPPKKETPRGHTSPTLHLGKASPLKGLAADAKPSINPRRSMSPKPKGLAPIIQSPTPGNPLAALSKPSPAVPAPQKSSPAKAATAPQKLSPAPTKTAPTATAPRAGPPPAPSMRPEVKRPAPLPPKDAGLSGDRIKALHASYVEARKKTNASPVSYEKLEQNIRQTEQKLLEKHRGRQVDFDVSIKDGRAILKPRLK